MKLTKEELASIAFGVANSIQHECETGRGEWLVGRDDKSISQESVAAVDDEGTVELLITTETDMESGEPTEIRKVRVKITAEDIGPGVTPDREVVEVIASMVREDNTDWHVSVDLDGDLDVGALAYTYPRKYSFLDFGDHVDLRHNCKDGKILCSVQKADPSWGRTIADAVKEECRRRG